jgi:hypothetical protein
VVSKMFGPLRDLILDQIEASPSPEQEAQIGKHLLLAGELLEPAELVELYQVIGLSAEQRECFISSFTLMAFRSLNKS